MYNPDWLRFCKRAVRTGPGTDHLLSPELQLVTRRLGSEYGGWVVAVDPLNKAASPIVLSFGSGDDISFDEEITRRYGARVYGFDPKTESLNWIAARGKPPNMKIYPIGIAIFDGRQRFSVPAHKSGGNFSAKATVGRQIVCDVMRYDSILAQLELRHVDVLKLDVEGSKFAVIGDILGSSILPVQLLVEFHHRLAIQTRQTVEMIRDSGFCLFAVSPGGQELSFIRRDAWMLA